MVRGILDRITPDRDVAQRRGQGQQSAPDWPIPRPRPEGGLDAWQDRDQDATRARREHLRRDDGLFPNGSFEDGARFWNLEEEMTIPAQPSQAFRGQNFLECIGPGPARNYACRSTETFDVDPGETFTGIVAVSPVSGTFARLGARVAWFDFRDTFLSTTDIFTTTTSGGWQKLRAPVQAPASASRGLWEFYVNNLVGTVRWDIGRLKPDERSDAGAATIAFTLFTGTLALANGKVKSYIAASITPPAGDVRAIGGRFREAAGGRWRKFRIDDLDNLSTGVILWEERANIDPNTGYFVEMWPLYEGGGAGVVHSEAITSASGEQIPGFVTNLPESVTIGSHSPELRMGHVEQLTEPDDRSRVRGGLRIGMDGANTVAQTGARAADPVDEVINTAGYGKRINPNRVLMVAGDMSTVLSTAVDDAQKKWRANFVRLLSGSSVGVDRLVSASDVNRLADDLKFGDAARSVSDVSGWAHNPGGRINSKAAGVARVDKEGLANKSTADVKIDIKDTEILFDSGERKLLGTVTLQVRKGSKVELDGCVTVRAGPPSAGTQLASIDVEVMRVQSGADASVQKFQSLGGGQVRTSHGFITVDEPPNGMFGSDADSVADITYECYGEFASGGTQAQCNDRSFRARNIKHATV